MIISDSDFRVLIVKLNEGNDGWLQLKAIKIDDDKVTVKIIGLSPVDQEKLISVFKRNIESFKTKSKEIQNS